MWYHCILGLISPHKEQAQVISTSKQPAKTPKKKQHVENQPEACGENTELSAGHCDTNISESAAGIQLPGASIAGGKVSFYQI